MKAPEFNIALSRVGEVVTCAGNSARELLARHIARRRLITGSGAPREVAPVCADGAKSRASIDE
jgi:hypothetical protein